MRLPFLVPALILTLAAAPACGAASGGQSSSNADEKELATTIWVFPPEAIKSAMTMKAAEFNETHPGINVSDTGLTDEGFYVRYEHHGLVYYFGPIADISTGVKWRSEMELLRTRLVEKRPELESSVVYLVKIDPDFEFGGAGAASSSTPSEGTAP